MVTSVNGWKQTGKVFVWRYAPEKKKQAGWHLTAEDEACDTLKSLLEAMQAGQGPSRRTIALHAPTEAVWGVPNFGPPRKEALSSLVLEWEPTFADLFLAKEDERLVLRVGETRVTELLTGLSDLKRGEGDYFISPAQNDDNRRLWFWWMSPRKSPVRPNL